MNEAIGVGRLGVDRCLRQTASLPGMLFQIRFSQVGRFLYSSGEEINETSLSLRSPQVSDQKIPWQPLLSENTSESRVTQTYTHHSNAI